MRYGIDVPRNFVTNRKDVPLRMEMLSLADFPKVEDRHDTNVEGQQRLALLVTWYNRDTVALGEDCVRLQPLRLGKSLMFRRTRWSYNPRNGTTATHHRRNFT